MRISGSLEGRLEPCGCASGQLGGLARRSFYLLQNRAYDLLIEGGNMIKGGTLLDLEKLNAALTVLDMRGYHALGIGPDDLQAPLDQLGMYLSAYDVPAVASDLVAVGTDGGADLPVRPFVDHAGPPAARIASLVMTLPEGEPASRFKLRAPEDAWRAAMEGAGEQARRILLVHGTAAQARQMASLTPKPDLVVGVGAGHHDPPREHETVAGVPVVFPGVRGRMLLDVTLVRRRDGSPSLTRYAVVELEGSRSAPGALEDKEAKEVLMQHRRDVKEQDILTKMADRLPTATGARFVGNATCRDCHPEAFDVWAKTKHARAWATLEEAERGTRYGWPVTAYPDCVACHVVGYGWRSGFVNPKATAHLQDVGCEECHGPGSAHVAARSDDRPSSEGRLGDVTPDVCLRCHDFEQSPTFDYAKRWKDIEHY
jgi:hypothetical protein